ncbi:hypothetical protein [Porphyromonas pogonae]|uniref:hypothetical protein n=1 Tax=Porphyromonas pogonae TaxID=867595 RepID=UPI002E79D266|nr:hypothetical protein [Porphyromonas pogonae]
MNVNKLMRYWALSSIALLIGICGEVSSNAQKSPAYQQWISAGTSNPKIDSIIYTDTLYVYFDFTEEMKKFDWSRYELWEPTHYSSLPFYPDKYSEKRLTEDEFQQLHLVNKDVANEIAYKYYLKNLRTHIKFYTIIKYNERYVCRYDADFEPYYEDPYDLFSIKLKRRFNYPQDQNNNNTFSAPYISIKNVNQLPENPVYIYCGELFTPGNYYLFDNRVPVFKINEYKNFKSKQSVPYRFEDRGKELKSNIAKELLYKSSFVIDFTDEELEALNETQNIVLIFSVGEYLYNFYPVEYLKKNTYCKERWMPIAYLLSKYRIIVRI